VEWDVITEVVLQETLMNKEVQTGSIDRDPIVLMSFNTA
jgi:hypothetical protein